MRRFFTRKKNQENPTLAPVKEKPLPPTQPVPPPPPLKDAYVRPALKVDLFSTNGQGGGGAAGDRGTGLGIEHDLTASNGTSSSRGGGGTKGKPSIDDEEGSLGPGRERRQVAFVSPTTTPAAGRRSPSPTLPSLPAQRAPTTSIGPSGTLRANAAYYHPPASLGGPASGYKSAASVWRDESGGGSVGSHHGHGQSASADSADRSVIAPDPRTGSPMSFASSRRGSGGVGPADTWGGTVIGGKQGDDIYQPMTWSEMTELDLVENLSGRERTRQEVLWEIVASEERYVGELLSLKENYVDPLLHPLRSPTLGSSPSSPPFPNALDSPGRSTPVPGVLTPPQMSSDVLPIAARFARTISQTSRTSSISRHTRDFIPDIDSEDSHPLDTKHSTDTRAGSVTPHADPHHTFDSPRSTPTAGGASRSRFRGFGITNPNRSAVSLTRTATGEHEEPTRSGGIRHYLRPPPPPNKLQRTTPAGARAGSASTPIELPDSLKLILEVIGDNLLRGHQDLSVKLKEKYLEQFPLVRDLTSVWAEQAWIIQQYNVYVLHLEKALKDVDTALAPVLNLKSNATKEEKKLAKLILRLEERASERGECGLAICLSKPFQRLLKYPLLFQNLLYHTDGSTHEYENAQSMAISIDTLVRSIEDEKVSEEERDRSRDAWARIEGVNDKDLMIPHGNRLLVHEEAVWRPPPGKERRTFSDAPTIPAQAPASPEPQPKKDRSTAERLRLLRGQKSFRRLSDMVTSDSKEPTMGSKRDIWLVIFSDVVLRCQRVGVTRLSGSALTKDAKESKASKKTKRRSMPGRERNLYKFVKVERWEVYSGPLPRASAERAKDRDGSAPAAGGSQPSLEELAEAAEAFTRSRRESQMSFSYEMDEPKPVASTVLKASVHQPASSSGSVVSAPVPGSMRTTSPRAMSQSTQMVLAKRTPAVAKFSNRIAAGPLASGAVSPSPVPRASSALSHPRAAYEAPTTSTLAKARGGSRPTSPPTARAGARRRAGSATGSRSIHEPHHRRRTGSGPQRPPSPPSTAAAAAASSASLGVPPSQSQRGKQLPRQPSEDFSAFKSYYDTPPASASQLGLVFPGQA